LQNKGILVAGSCKREVRDKKNFSLFRKRREGFILAIGEKNMHTKIQIKSKYFTYRSLSKEARIAEG